MRITSLRLLRFRNHLETRIVPGVARAVLLRGPNGAGKTSLLEAIHLVATGIGVKTRRDQDFVRFGSDGYRIEIGLEAPSTLALRFRNEEGRRAEADGALLPRWTDLIGRLRMTLLRPDDIALIEGAPDLRRRYLDVMLCQADRSYFDALRRYRRAQRQMTRVDPRDVRLVTPFRRLLHAEMPMIFERRARCVEELRRHLRAMAETMGLRAALDLEYAPGIPADAAGRDWKGAADRCLEEWNRLDRVAAFAPFGPGRDDLRPMMNGVPARRFGSQGQKRILALLLRLAEARFLSEVAGDDAIILMDDVLGELDEERTRALCGLLGGLAGQVWIAGTNLSTMEEFWPDRVEFDIVDGSLQGVETH
jgi:DNA replication and repair protein RecF